MLAGVVVALAYQVLLLAFAAALLATLLRSIGDFIDQHTRLGAGAAFGCAIIAVLALLGTGGYIFGAQVSAQINALADELPGAAAALRAELQGQATSATSRSPGSTSRPGWWSSSSVPCISARSPNSTGAASCCSSRASTSRACATPSTPRPTPCGAGSSAS